MQQSLNARSWKNTLDTMSAKVAKLSASKPIRNVYEVSKFNRCIRDGNFQTGESILPMGAISMVVILIINFVMTQSNLIGERYAMPVAIMVTM